MTRRRELPALVLASGSPRRRELLRGLGVRFSIRPSEVDESLRDGEPADAYALRLAREKAAWHAVAGEIVLAADTVVVLGEELFGKPSDPADARRMLRRIAGRTHTVLTAVALYETDGARLESTLERSEVEMAALSEAEIDWYVETGEPLDKAGSYAIQNRGALFVERIRGNYTNVVGLPLPATSRLFSALGYDLRQWIDD